MISSCFTVCFLTVKMPSLCSTSRDTQVHCGCNESYSVDTLSDCVSQSVTANGVHFDADLSLELDFVGLKKKKKKKKAFDMDEMAEAVPVSGQVSRALLHET